MTDEEEFSVRSQLRWTREGDAWISLYHRRRMGTGSPRSRQAEYVPFPEIWGSLATSRICPGQGLRWLRP